MPIDTRYYLENQLSKPLMRIFEPILGEKAGSLCEYLSPAPVNVYSHKQWPASTHAVSRSPRPQSAAS